MKFVSVILLLSALGASAVSHSIKKLDPSIDSRIFYQTNSLVLKKSLSSKNNRPQPEIEKKIFTVPKTDARKVETKPAKLPSIVDKTKRDKIPYDPNHNKFRDPSNEIDKEKLHLRKRSHFAE